MAWDLRQDVLLLGSLTKTDWSLRWMRFVLDLTQKQWTQVFYVNFSVGHKSIWFWNI